MPNIKPISDLRNYSDVLKDVAIGAPVFLTKNGRGKYVILDIQDYENLNQKTKLTLKERIKDYKDKFEFEEWDTGKPKRNEVL